MGIAGEDCFGRVLLIPCRGYFMWPLAVPGLGLRYLVIRFTVMLGQPLRKPFRVAYSNDDIMGLPSDWWEILTALERVHTKFVNAAITTVGMIVGRGAQSIKGPDCDTIGAAKEFLSLHLGRVGPGPLQWPIRELVLLDR